MTPLKCAKCGGEMISYVDGKGVTYCKPCDKYWTAVERLTAENEALRAELKTLNKFIFLHFADKAEIE